MFVIIANLITRTFCLHLGSQLRRTNGTTLYVECLKCGHPSSGIITG